MAKSPPTTPSSRLPHWLSSKDPAFRAVVTLLSIIFFVVQGFGNLPSSVLRNSMQPIRSTFHDLGLYQRGWGMFAATNTRTATVRNELTYADGTREYVQYIYLRPGYSLSPWNEVMQDLQIDDTNDKNRTYLKGFLHYTCRTIGTPEKPLVAIAFQQQMSHFPIADKRTAARENPWRTLHVEQCQTP